MHDSPTQPPVGYGEPEESLAGRPPGKRGRPPLRQEAMLGELRRQITGGELRPGDRLPVRTELQQRFSASCITVQRVVDRLADDGLVEARGPQGTFVVERPPHLHRLVLLFPFGPDQEGRWLGYYAAIERAADVLRGEGLDLVTCHAFSHRTTTPGFDRLQENCRHGLIAGMIFASPPEYFSGQPVAAAPLTLVALCTTFQPGVLELGTHPGDFLRRALATVRARGRQRVAMLASTEQIMDQGHVARMRATFAAAGLELREQWLLGADLSHPGSATSIIRLLCARWAGDRPDALIIADDNFEEAAIAALRSEGVRVPDDLLVLAHANFPTVTTPAMPVLRLGYDAVELLRQAVARLTSMRAGLPTEPYMQPATFADGS